MKIIDVHHHAFPPDAKVSAWNLQTDSNAMHENGIDEIILSCPLQTDSNKAQQINEFLYNQCLMNKTYHMIASLGYDNVQKSIDEIDLYKKKAVGFSLNTHNYDIYIGNDSLNALFDKLNLIGATIFLHPNHFRAPANGKVVFTGNDSVYEYTFDTARAIFDMVLQGKIKRWPNIKWVLPHAGGVIPFLAHRVSVSSYWNATNLNEDDIMNQLKSMYYDLTLNHCDINYSFMKEFVGANHLLYGSDYPNSGESLLNRDMKYIKNCTIFNEKEKEQIMFKNAELLFLKKDNV